MNTRMLTPRRTAGAIAAVIASGTFILSGAGTANAAALYTLKNVSTGRCVDDSLTYGLRAVGCNGSLHQVWQSYVWSGHIEPSFINEDTARCIDDSLTYGLRVTDCNQTSHQDWYVSWNQDYSTSTTFMNDATAHCMDDSLTYGLRAVGCNNTTHQEFLENGAT
jgi:hypothetical protein